MLRAGLFARRSLDLLNEHLGGLGAHLVSGYLHGGHGGRQHAAHLVAGQTDDPHVFRDTDVPLGQGPDGAQPLYVHGGDDGVEPAAAVQQLVGALVAVFKAVGRLFAGAEDRRQSQLLFNGSPTQLILIANIATSIATPVGGLFVLLLIWRKDVNEGYKAPTALRICMTISYVFVLIMTVSAFQKTIIPGIVKLFA